MSKQIKLYTTLGCHLCEQAQAMFEYLQQSDSMIQSQFSIHPVEIAENDELLEVYGVRIPVLASDSKELGWPFDLEQLREWLIKS